MHAYAYVLCTNKYYGFFRHIEFICHCVVLNPHQLWLCATYQNHTEIVRYWKQTILLINTIFTKLLNCFSRKNVFTKVPNLFLPKRYILNAHPELSWKRKARETVSCAWLHVWDRRARACSEEVGEGYINQSNLEKYFYPAVVEYNVDHNTARSSMVEEPRALCTPNKT